MNNSTARVSVRRPATHSNGFAAGKRARLPLAPVREAIWNAAVDLVAVGETRDPCTVLASRFNTSVRVVGLCLMVEGMRHQRAASALRSGIASALSMARDAETAVLADVAKVA